MLTKLGVTALLGTIGAAMAGGTARADEPCYEGQGASRVVVEAPRFVEPVGWFHGGGDGRWGMERERREHERERAWRHAEWLRERGGYGMRFGRGYDQGYNRGYDGDGYRR